MPRYFIDFQEGKNVFKDEEGGELNDLNTARQQAVELFSHFDYKILSDEVQNTCTASVRNEQGKVVYQADLTFSGKYL